MYPECVVETVTQTVAQGPIFLTFSKSIDRVVASLQHPARVCGRFSQYFYCSHGYGLHGAASVRPASFFPVDTEREKVGGGRGDV